VSGLRCRPGDLAIVIGANAAHPELTGRVVDVIKLAPPYAFALPDGHMHAGTPPGFWVVRFHQPVAAPVEFLGRMNERPTLFACAPDFALKPIRGQRQPEATPTAADKPQTVEA
jgi:hypothetical protein